MTARKFRFRVSQIDATASEFLFARLREGAAGRRVLTDRPAFRPLLKSPATQG
jgi:hypothetical protein